MNIAEEMAYRAIGSGDREMKKKTILFFQGLFENSIAQDTILSFCKDTQRIEIQKKIQFLRKRILLSDRAEEINTKLKMLESQIEEQKMPIDFWRIQENINILTGSIQLYTLRSMQLLEQEFFMPDNIDLISPIFEKYALSKVEQMLSYTIYYGICQSGSEMKKYLDIYEEIPGDKEYKIQKAIAVWKKITTVVQMQKILQWKYKQEMFNIGNMGEIPQFAYSGQENSGCRIIPGIPETSYIKKEDSIPLMEIEGKGNITNLNPKQEDLFRRLSEGRTICFGSDLNIRDLRIFDLDFYKNPVDVLENYFQGEKFVVSPEEYFRFANNCMIFQWAKRNLGD